MDGRDRVVRGHAGLGRDLDCPPARAFEPPLAWAVGRSTRLYRTGINQRANPQLEGVLPRLYAAEMGSRLDRPKHCRIRLQSAARIIESDDEHSQHSLMAQAPAPLPAARPQVADRHYWRSADRSVHPLRQVPTRALTARRFGRRPQPARSPAERRSRSAPTAGIELGRVDLRPALPRIEVPTVYLRPLGATGCVVEWQRSLGVGVGVHPRSGAGRWSRGAGGCGGRVARTCGEPE
jgi:hypothetical protein